MKILHIANLPSPYRVDFWNKLGKKIDLTVVCERETATDRDKSWVSDEAKCFSFFFCKSIKYGVDKGISITPLKYIKKNKNAQIIVGNFYTITGLIEILYMRANKIPYWIEGDGAYPSKVESFKARIKRWMFTNAVGCLSTCDNHDKYYMCYGVKPERIFRYNFSSLHKSDVLQEVPSAKEKRAIRAKLGMLEDYIILYVGRFMDVKGLDMIINVANRFMERPLSSGVGFYLVGGEKLNPFLRQGQTITDNIHVCGFKSQKELAEIYMAADLLIFPTRGDAWGLVVNEAMAKGLPIVTTDRCNSGLELVHEGENGFIIQSGDDEGMDKCLLGMINTDIKSPGYLRSLGEKSLEYIKDYTIENMVEQHLDIFNGV